MLKRIAIIDDDPTMHAALREAVSSLGHEVQLFANGEEGLAHLRQPGADLVISDVRMPGMSGLELLKRFSQIPFILISGFATVPEAVDAMKLGAFDFIVKPFSHRELISLVEAALARKTLDGPADHGASNFVTENPRMNALLDFARQVAKSHASILIQGESGTGKELLARYIHAHSRRHGGPFVAVNCAALPEGLLESELFGYERGAFTGAFTGKAGKFELAHNGTLLLDEISEMPLSLQAKLLRVLQEREVDRLGAKRPLPVDIRVISTTNRELREMVRAGSFREDLFYRLNVVPARLFPLRERLDDIAPLAAAFFSKHGYAGWSLTPAALVQLRHHSWRGNVRELFNVLERAAIMAECGAILPEHLLLEDDLPWGNGFDPARAAAALVSDAPQFQGARHMAPGKNVRSQLSVREMEEQLIFQTLTQANNNRTQAAKMLGISVRTLRNKLKVYRERAHSVEA
jgi:DNA-binding NtrC family response regulator